MSMRKLLQRESRACDANMLTHLSCHHYQFSVMIFRSLEDYQATVTAVLLRAGRQQHYMEQYEIIHVGALTEKIFFR